MTTTALMGTHTVIMEVAVEDVLARMLRDLKKCGRMLNLADALEQLNRLGISLTSEFYSLVP